MKRTFDIILASTLLIIFIIPICLIAITVKLSSQGPILYWSNRVGKNNHLFAMPKFRSMNINTPEVATHLLINPKAALSPIGHFLRRSSLDELPQLWSILKGDMSFVGPRPALFNQYDLINLRTTKAIHLLVPGLTGWAQINGRDELSIIEKTNFDDEYIKRQSFLFDLCILWWTLSKVFSQNSISH